MTGRFADRVAVVTGASRGIGLAIARRLVEDGAHVVLTARHETQLTEAVAELGGPRHASAVAGRADDPLHQEEVIGVALDRGGVHLLVNNAAVNPHYGPLLDLDDEVAAKMVRVNVLAPLAWTRRAHQAWMGEHGGAVVNVSSVAGLGTARNIGFYGLTKAALLHLTRQLAVEVGPGTRVNAVAPAVVKTRFAAALYEDREAELALSYPLRRLGVPADVGEAVAFLLSDQASWVTGHTLAVDGGVTLVGPE